MDKEKKGGAVSPVGIGILAFASVVIVILIVYWLLQVL